MTTQTKTNRPDFDAVTVTDRGKGKAPRFTKMGVAFKTDKGNIRILLDALPVNGEILLMLPKDKDQPADAPADGQ